MHVKLTRSQFGGRVLVVNRRRIPVDHIVEVTRIGAARWNGKLHGGETFHIEGGRAAGGGPRDWFIDSPLFGTLHVSSFVEAVKEIENC